MSSKANDENIVTSCTDELNNVHITCTADEVDVCANCGEEGRDGLKACTACKLVKYCNRDCQIAHRSKHKKACKKRAAELHDEKLFKQPPSREECPICMLPFPLAADQAVFHPCCGKRICIGCIYAISEKEGANILCAFCRTPYAKSAEEEVRRNKRLMEKGNSLAFKMFAGCYVTGSLGMPQDWAKANELLLKAGNLGCNEAYNNLGNAYSNGQGVEVDKKKAKHYWELAAMNGSISARYNLGCMEEDAGNHRRAMKHVVISAKAGHEDSLDMVTAIYKHGHKLGFVTKDIYAQTLRAYQKSQNEMKSEKRDKAEQVYRTLG